jgi:hypothetical protein
MKKACSLFLFCALSGSIGVGAPLERIGDLGVADMNITNPKFRVKESLQANCLVSPKF